MKHTDFQKKYFDNNVQDSIKTKLNNLNNLKNTNLCEAEIFIRELGKVFCKFSNMKVKQINGCPTVMFFSDGSSVGLGYAFNKTGHFNI